MSKLTEEQERALILIGQEDDGSQSHVLVDGNRIIGELTELGLVHRIGENRYDLTDEGEREYGERIGEDVS
jgi:hypothetical protein